MRHGKIGFDMDKLIRVSKSVIGEEEKKAVTNVLTREYLGMGEEVKNFENELSNFFRRKTACFNTGTSAIHLALQALGLKTGDEVLVQSLTYLATYQAISATGALPISCEVDEKTFTIDLEDAESKINSSTKVILPVHYAGCPGNLDEIYNFAKKYNLRVIEDAAHAFGTIYKNKVIGSFGDIACFSFDGIKNITCGEGGAIVTDDNDVMKKVYDARLLGVAGDTEKRYSNNRSWEFNVYDQGWRYHMSNIMASIGIEQLKKFDTFKKKRQELAKYYQSQISDNKNIILLNHNYNEIVPHIFVIRLVNHNRNYVREKLLEKGIQTGLHYYPNHLLDYYAKDNSLSLQHTEMLYNQILTLPLHPDLTQSDVSFICNSLISILN